MQWQETVDNHVIQFTEEGTTGVEAVLAKCLTCSVELGRYDKESHPKYRLAVAALRWNSKKHALDKTTTV